LLFRFKFIFNPIPNFIYHASIVTGPTEQP